MWKTLAFAAASLLTVAAMPAQALPAAPVQTAVAASDLTLVADGCGRGRYRDRYGRCRGGGAVVVTPGLAVGPVVVAPRVVAPVVVAPRRACPRGMYMTRSGRCVW